MIEGCRQQGETGGKDIRTKKRPDVKEKENGSLGKGAGLSLHFAY